MSKVQVSIVMGSDSDLEIMREAGKALDEFGIAYEIDVTSAHRSPDRSADFAKKAAERGIKVIIAGAGGAAHLAGVIAAHTILPVIGVPIPSTSLNGMDSLLSTVQMPAGIPVGTLAIGTAGARNAALLAIAILGTSRPELRDKLRRFRQEQKQKILRETLA
jgi:5-(carboxyamino)imidazole ribonucleotide mutase